MNTKCNINIAQIREDDIIFLSDGEPRTVKKVAVTNGIYLLTVLHNDKEITLSYNITGDSLENKEMNLTGVEFVSKPEDDLTFYEPKFEIDMLPILRVNGEDKIVYTLMDLNGLEIKEPQTLETSFKYVVIASLFKKKGRSFQCLKQEKIICGDREACEKKLEEIGSSFVGVNKENEQEIKNLYEKVVFSVD